MSFFSTLKSIFSPAGKSSAEPVELPSVEYQGFTITPAPVKEEGGYRVNGMITKGALSHRFIRADMLPSSEGCATEMLRKAKQMIDQQGDGLF